MKSIAISMMVVAVMVLGGVSAKAQCCPSKRAKAKAKQCVKNDKGKCVKPSCGKCASKLKKQTTCPVMKGKKINKKLFADVDGKRIYVCCSGCIAVIKKNPKKYLKQMKDAGIAPAKTPVVKVKK